MKKSILYLFIVLILLSLTHGLEANITEFNDGSTSGNITSNVTRYISIVANGTVSISNLTISGLPGLELNKIPDNYSYSDDISEEDLLDLFDSNVSTYPVLNPGENGNAFLNYSKNYSITNGNILQVYEYHRNVYVCFGDECPDYEYVNYSIPDDCMTDLVLRYNSSKANCSGQTCSGGCNSNIYSSISCYNGTSWRTIVSKGNDNCVSVYSKNEYYIYEIEPFFNKYPENVSIYVNDNIVQNINGVFNTSSIISLNDSVMTSELGSNSTVKIVFKADSWGKIEYSDLYIKYNWTDAAYPQIVSPDEITGTIEYGGDHTTTVNITNTGDWNASNITFFSVSSLGTPNYNDKITSVCSNSYIVVNNSVLCNVTFSGLYIDPEPDERLRASVVGTDSDGIVYSNSIDIDLSVLSPESSSSGGGSSTIYSNWKVWRPLNQLWIGHGWPGIESTPKKFQVYNNESSGIDFEYRAEGLECKIQPEQQEIKGSSIGTFEVICTYPKERDTGRIIITGGGKESSIDVVLMSDWIGFIGVLISGGFGIEWAFAALIVLILSIVIILVGVSK